MNLDKYTNSDERLKLEKKLKAYRMKKSAGGKLHPAVVFRNSHLEDLLDKRPQTMDSLAKVSGFAGKRLENYGEDILKILSIGITKSSSF